MDCSYTLKVELMALLIAQMWGNKGNPLKGSSLLNVRPVICGGGGHDIIKGIDRRLLTLINPVELTQLLF